MLQAKISMPQIGKNIIRRETIEKRLHDLSRYKLAYIIAPAGFGKTTAVAGYIIEENIKCAWFSVDIQDNDPVQFWSYLIQAIADCTQMGGLLKIDLDLELISANITTDLLLESIGSMEEEFTIVIDDYHLITNATVKGSVGHFVKYLPPNIHLIVISRTETNDELSLLNAKGMAVGLGVSDLAFDKENTEEFFSRRSFVLSEKEINEIATSTEGWAAGLVAVSLYIEQHKDISNAFGIASGTSKNINTVLEKEVFSSWPEEIRTFLVYTSFLDRLSGPICSALTGNEKSAEILKSLSWSNGFVIALDGQEQWFRYHHLFQEFLASRFELLGKETKCRLYRLAGEWFLEQGQKMDAINWFIQAKEYARAWQLISTLNTAPLNGYESQVKSWIGILPEEVYRNTPFAYSFYSWMLFMDNKIDAAQLWEERGWENFERVKTTLEQNARDNTEACLLFGNLNLDIVRLDTKAVMNDIERLMKLKLVRPVQMGRLNWYESDLMNCPYAFKGRIKNIEMYLGFTAYTYQYMGQRASYISIIIAEYYYERNMLDELGHVLVKDMGAITESKDAGAIIPAFLAFAKCRIAKGDFTGAFAIIKKAREILDERVGSIWSYHLDVFEAHLYLRLGNLEQAKSILGLEKLGIFGELSCVREAEYTTYAKLLMLTNDLDKALVLLHRMETFIRKNDRLGSLIKTLCLIAICYNLKGETQNALSTLEQALTPGSEQGYVRTFVDEGEAMAVLLDKYIQANRNGGDGQYVAYARDLYRQTNEAITVLHAATKEETPARTDYTTSLLTEREIEIIKLIARKKTNKEIADELFLSLDTIKQYNSRIFDKLGAKNRHEAVAKAKLLMPIE